MHYSFENPIILRQGLWQMKLLPMFGNSVLSLSYNGRKILREPENLEQLVIKPVVYGLPLLFPANRTRDAKFTFRGKEYTLPMTEPLKQNHIHGLFNRAPFHVESVGVNRAVSSIENNGALYPFPFRLVMEDVLTEQGLTRTLTVVNTGNTDMPYTLAYHTTFVEPAFFKVPLGQCFPVDARHIPTGELVELTEKQQQFRNGTGVNGGLVSGFYTSAGNTAVVDDFCFSVSKQFDEWILHNGNGQQGYLCIEPQCGEVNGLNTQGHRVLAPGAQEVFWVKIERSAEK